MKEFYLTLKKETTGLFKDKGSRFLAFAYPVDSVEQIKTCLAELKKKYHDARHHCYAYILGNEGKEYRANDDGEPNHSAGDVILGVIRSKGLTNVLIVVVRYFGGTKLGISGLINAYKTASENALGNAQVIRVEIRENITINFPYASTNEVMQLLGIFEASVNFREFREECKINFGVKNTRKTEMIENLNQLLSRKILFSFEVTPG